MMLSCKTAAKSKPHHCWGLGVLALAGALVLACAPTAGETDSASGETDQELMIQELSWKPAKHVLGGTLQVHLSMPGVLHEVRVMGPEGEQVVPASGLLNAGPGTELSAMILGLRAEQDYAIEVVVHNDMGTEVRDAFQHTTDPLPEPFVPLEFVASDPQRMQPGITLFDSTAREGFASRGGFLVAVDAHGEVVWYYTGPEVQQPCDIRRLQNGHLMFLGIGPDGLSTRAVEIDMLGEIHGVWNSDDLGIGAAHADLAEVRPELDSPILTAGLEVREIAGYPGDKTYTVVGDTIIEFSRSGEIVHSLSLLDILDPYRIVTPDFHAGFWAGLYGLGSKDWSHVNAVSYVAQDDAYLVSARHQDIVFLVSRTGELIWVIGQDDPKTPGDDDWPYLTLVGEGSLPNHMHAAKMLADDHVIMFDNANASGMSRAVEYAIDRAGKTLTQVWSYTDPDFDPPLFSAIIGDADRLANNNVLVDFGAIDPDPQTLDLAGAWAHIVEVDPATGDKVFELNVRGASQDPTQRLVYRVQRQPSLYP